jgi:hypothetical protein
MKELRVLRVILGCSESSDSSHGNPVILVQSALISWEEDSACPVDDTKIRKAELSEVVGACARPGDQRGARDVPNTNMVFSVCLWLRHDLFPHSLATSGR